MEKDLIKNLNPNQKEAVLSTEGPLLILAGAGSGKTKTLTHRIAYLVREKKISPYNILAVTFTNKAAFEMKKRIAALLGQDDLEMANKLLPWMGTFHSICVKILRRDCEKVGYKSSFVIYDSDDQLTAIKKVMKELSLDPKQYSPQAVKSYISGAKNELMTPKKYQEIAHLNSFTEIVSDVYQKYQKLLINNNAMDFDDLIMKTVELLQKNEEIKFKYREKYKYILIDEYQDTNHAQYTLIRLLTNDQDNICVVGDDAQSIYSWRGATIRNIMEFEKDFPAAHVVKLEQNYRSTKNILEAAGAIISKNSKQKKKNLWTENPLGELVNLYESINEQDEGKFIAEQISKLRETEKFNFKDFAILYRTNAQSRSLEEIMLKNGIPYKIVGGVKFYERKEIKDVLAYLRSIVNTQDSISLQRIINVPSRGITKSTIEKLEIIAREYSFGLWETIYQIANGDNGVSELAENHLNSRALNSVKSFYSLIDKWQNLLSSIKPTDFVVTVLKQSGYEKWLDDGTIEGETRMENIKELLTVMTKYDEFDATEGIRLFLEEVALITDLDNLSERDDAVVLMTLHSAKGLEFPVVFIAGMEENIFPHARSVTEPQEMEEERRLCYVGFTRAEKYLFITHAQCRRIFGSVYMNTPSRFIDDIPEKLRKYHSKKPSVQAIHSRLEKADKKNIVLDEDLGQYKSGDKVLHPKFGEGRIVQIKGGILKIAFVGNGVKSLAAAIAPLKKI